MEAAAIIKKIRAMSGITRKELAQLADVSPSTISRIERGEMDPTWGTMQKIFSATGYQLIGTSVVSSGDTSVIQAASACLAPILIQAYTPKSEALRSATTTVTTRQLPSNMRIPAGEWADRWKRAGWLKDSAGVDDLVAIAVTAGNAGKVARRRGARVPVEIPKGWRDLVDRLDEAGVAAPPGLDRGRLWWGVVVLEGIGGEVVDVESEGGLRFAARWRAVLDACSGPGRGPDQAEDLLRAIWEDASRTKILTRQPQ